MYEDVVLLYGNAIIMCWMILRVACISFAESTFIYLTFNSGVSKLKLSAFFRLVGTPKLFCFSILYFVISGVPSVFLNDPDLYRLATVVFVGLYFWYAHKRTFEKSVCNYNSFREARYILGVSVVLILAMDSFSTISHILLHMCCVSMGIYNAICSGWMLRGIYKSVIMIFNILFLVLFYKLRIFKMKDMRAILVNSWSFVPLVFCLLSIVYVRCNYVVFGSVPSLTAYRDTLLMILAFMLPTYWGFYLIMNHQTKLLNLRSNTTVNADIVAWILNPSVLEMTSLRVYDSDIFISNFESKKFILKEKLGKLGIDNECKGYSELILCLFLTRLLIGLKGWSFEREIYEQAALIVDVSVLELRTDIDGIINRVWSTSEPKTLVDGYYYPYCKNKTYDQTHRPTVDEFLMRIAGSI